MTVKEALEKRIPRVTQPQWAHAYLRLPLWDENTYGPWAELYDEPSQKALGIRPGSQRLCVLLKEIAEDPDYKVYEGPISPFEKDPNNYASTYKES